MPKFKNIKKSDKEDRKQKKVVKPKKKEIAPKKVIQKQFSPKISRLIPEQNISKVQLPQKHGHTTWILWGIIGLVLCIEAGGLYYQVQQLQKVQQERLTLQSEVTKWQDNMNTHPGYRDGYMQLAMLYYQLGNTTQANKNINSALAIDPNYFPALKLKGILLTSK